MTTASTTKPFRITKSRGGQISGGGRPKAKGTPSTFSQQILKETLTQMPFTPPVASRKITLSRKAITPSAPSQYACLFQATQNERISLIRKGVPAHDVVVISDEMGITKEKFYHLLRFIRATVNRRIKSDEPLPIDYSERVIGLQKLIGQVEVMVAESGSQEDFNAAHWVAEWLEEPNPALNHAKPAEFMDTIEGQTLVSAVLAQMQSGAYA